MEDQLPALTQMKLWAFRNSTLLLTWKGWPDGPCNDELRMIRDDSNNLLLDGQVKCKGGWSAKVRLKKIE